jgi:hypothetical protein
MATPAPIKGWSLAGLKEKADQDRREWFGCHAFKRKPGKAMP